jgi:hypothetical protein
MNVTQGNAEDFPDDSKEVRLEINSEKTKYLFMSHY